MGQPTTPIVFKLTPTEKEELDRVLHVGNYLSRSGAIRAGLGMLFAKHGMLKQTDKFIEDERLQHRPIASKKRWKKAEKLAVIPKATPASKMSATRKRKSAI